MSDKAEAFKAIRDVVGPEVCPPVNRAAEAIRGELSGLAPHDRPTVREALDVVRGASPRTTCDTPWRLSWSSMRRLRPGARTARRRCLGMRRSVMWAAFWLPWCSGADGGDRTRDLCLTKTVLYH